MKKKVSILLLTAVVIAGALTGCGSSKTAGSDTVFRAMETTDMKGDTVDSSVFKENKLTLVNVWNTGCGSCVQELPVLDQINRDYAEKGVAVKGLIYEFQAGLSDAGKKEAEELILAAGAEYQQLLASEDMAASDSLKKLQVFPTTFYVDSEGTIIDMIEGSGDYEEWAARIDKVLEKVQ